MYHTPEYKTADELLRAVGFEPCKKSTDRGYEISLLHPPKRDGCVLIRANAPRPRFDRLHALCNHGQINMHIDENIAGKHVAHASHPLVREKIRKIKELDRPDVLVPELGYLLDLVSR